jgi:hypothetical protein
MKSSTLRKSILSFRSGIELMNRWGLCILCVLLIGALITSYYLQIKRIRAVHETVVSIFAGMVVGLIIRLSPGHLIREMLVSWFIFFDEIHLTAEPPDLGDYFTQPPSLHRCLEYTLISVVQTHLVLQLAPSAHHSQLGLRAQAGESGFRTPPQSLSDRLPEGLQR